jgi:two-component system sensor histidine kinase TtrS
MQRAVEALLSGQADAAIVRTCLLEQLAQVGKLRPDTFKVIAQREEPGFSCVTSTPLYPDWAFAVTRNGDPDLAKRVATLLLSLAPSASGLSWGVPADYESVHAIYRELMLGPYADLRMTTLRGLMKSYRPYLFAVLLLIVGGVVHVVWVSYLIRLRTAALEAERARTRRLEDEASHLAQLSILGEMSGTLAHELNQPLTTIAAYAQGLQRRCAAGQAAPGVVAEATREIVSQTERASDVIRRVRGFARKPVAERQSRPMVDTVREAIKLFSVLLPELPAVNLDNRLGNDTVEADHVMLQQVLLNLMKNAADAMNSLPAADRSISVLIDRDGPAVTVAVADRGPEVSAETFDRLFDAFFTTKPGGLGLGLPICKSIIEAHGGWLRAERRQPPPGLVFRFSLPDDPNHG